MVAVDDGEDELAVAVRDGLEVLFVALVSNGRFLGYGDELVRDTAHGGNHHDDGLLAAEDDVFDVKYAFNGTDTGSSEFENSHFSLF